MILIAGAWISNGFIHMIAQSGESVNRSCSVVCLDDQWIPESYNVGAKTMINYGSEGIISVHETNDISDRDRYNREDFISFKVAIFRDTDDTMVSYSDKSYKKLAVQKVLSQCEPGDEVVIILDDPDKFSLPHHRIKVL